MSWYVTFTFLPNPCHWWPLLCYLVLCVWIGVCGSTHVRPHAVISSVSVFSHYSIKFSCFLHAVVNGKAHSLPVLYSARVSLLICLPVEPSVVCLTWLSWAALQHPGASRWLARGDFKGVISFPLWQGYFCRMAESGDSSTFNFS